MIITGPPRYITVRKKRTCYNNGGNFDNYRKFCHHDESSHSHDFTLQSKIIINIGQDALFDRTKNSSSRTYSSDFLILSILSSNFWGLTFNILTRREKKWRNDRYIFNWFSWAYLGISVPVTAKYISLPSNCFKPTPRLPVVS